VALLTLSARRGPDRNGKRSGPAANMQNSMLRLHCCLVDELLARAVGTEQLHQRIVQRQEEIPTRGREIGVRGL